MAFCTRCGQELTEGAKFCSNCGITTNSIQNNAISQRNTVFEGEIHKCPSCGEVLEAFVSKCPTCGYEIRGAENSNAVREFVAKLEKIEMKRAINAGTVTGLKKKISEMSSVNPIDKQKISLIRSFTIPNTKEDIFEFMILAASNIDIKLYGLTYHNSQIQGMLASSQREVSDAWLAKFEQAYEKAKIMFGTSQEFLNIQNLYQQKIREMNKKKMQYPMLILGAIIFIVFEFILIFVVL